MNNRFQYLIRNGSVLLMSAGALCLILFSIQRAPEAEFSSDVQVEFPRYEADALRRRDSSRPYMRRPQPRTPPTTDQPTAPIEPDPVLRGLRAIPESDGLMVLEANAIKHSWLFDALQGCIDFQSTSLPDGFPEDFDITESIDRVATGDGVALVSGFFDGIDWETAMGTSMEEAENAQIFDSSEGQVFAIWDNQMMITAESREQLDTVLTGLNDPTSVATEGGIQQSDAYGDIYGKFNGGLLERLVPENLRDDLTPELIESLNGIDFHLDMSQGLAMSASVSSESEDTLKALSFVMDLGLNQARSGLVELAAKADAPEAAALSTALQASQIGSASDGVLNFDLALPRQVMEDFLRETCSRFREDQAMKDGLDADEFDVDEFEVNGFGVDEFEDSESGEFPTD